MSLQDTTSTTAAFQFNVNDTSTAATSPDRSNLKTPPKTHSYPDIEDNNAKKPSTPMDLQDFSSDEYSPGSAAGSPLARHTRSSRKRTKSKFGSGNLKTSNLKISTSAQAPMSPSSRVSLVQQLSKVDGLETPPTVKVCRFHMNPQKMKKAKESYTPKQLRSEADSTNKTMTELLKKTKEQRIQRSGLLLTNASSGVPQPANMSLSMQQQQQ